MNGADAIRDLRERLASGRPLVGTFLGLASIAAAELCARALPWVVVDLEHGTAAEADLLGLLQAADCGGAPCLVRVPAADSAVVARALDAGAAGIMFPRVETAEDAVAAVARTLHPPHGSRGVARIVRARAYGRAAIEAVLDSAAAHAKPAGLMVSSPAQAKAWLDRGATFVAVSTDLGLLAAASADLETLNSASRG